MMPFDPLKRCNCPGGRYQPAMFAAVHDVIGRATMEAIAQSHGFALTLRVEEAPASYPESGDFAAALAELAPEIYVGNRMLVGAWDDEEGNMVLAYVEQAHLAILTGPQNPTGWKLEDLLAQLQNEIQAKDARIANDVRPAAQTVHLNNLHIIRLLAQAEVLQRKSLEALATIGPDQGPRGTPRIGAGSEAAP